MRKTHPAVLPTSSLPPTLRPLTRSPPVTAPQLVLLQRCRLISIRGIPKVLRLCFANKELRKILRVLL